MNMTPKNIGLLIGMVVIGSLLGLAYPEFFALLLVPLVIFVVIIVMRNKGGADADETIASQARQFTARPGMGAIYIMRKGFVGGQQGMNVTVDGNLKTQFRTGRFAKADVAPGDHVVEVQMASGSKSAGETKHVTVAEGECVLLDAKMNVGALQGTLETFETRNPADARTRLSGLKLVEWTPSDG
jgi:hypothetical protein